MADCVDWVNDGSVANAILVCNNFSKCGHRVGPSQPMLCDCCEAKMPKIPVSYAEPGPRIFACGHEERVGDFGFGALFGCCVDYRMKCPDCLGWKRPKLNPSPTIGDFSKFTMPLDRPKGGFPKLMP